jgi:hypothetical protein
MIANNAIVLGAVTEYQENLILKVHIRGIHQTKRDTRKSRGKCLIQDYFI